MKNLFIAALLMVTFGTSAFAADVTGKSVFSTFKSQFKSAANVTWTSTADFTKASFDMNDQKMEAFYNTDGELIAKTICINSDDLPTGIKRNIAKKYGSYNMTEAIRYEGEEDAWYVSVEDGKESLILKIAEDGFLNVFKRTVK